jgi:hypothetical protein
MVMMDIGTDVSLLLDKPKLLAKLVVVGAVTLNRILLHLVAFPMITGKPRNPNKRPPSRHRVLILAFEPCP